MINYFAAVGTVFAIVSAWAMLLLAIVGLCHASNRVSHKVLDTFGGWATFVRYRKWYWEQTENKEQGHD